MTKLAIGTASIFLALAAFGAHPQTQPSNAKIRSAVGKSLALMTASGDHWFKVQGCSSCHHQAAPFLAYRMAEERGLPLKMPSLRNQTLKTLGDMDGPPALDFAVQGCYELDPGLSESLIFQASDAVGFTPSIAVAAEMRFNAYRQSADGSWGTLDRRPPQTGSTFASTATTVRAIQLYLAPFDRKLSAEKVSRARIWLEQSKPDDLEDSAYRLMGLAWAGSNRNFIQAAASVLLKAQRSDGGWAQLGTRPSDSYATGLAMVALHEAAKVSCDSAPYKRGIRFLLHTENSDGSWHVASRIHPPAPVSPTYFESGFPYGHDQIVSITGTAWADMALMEALPKQNGAIQPLYAPHVRPKTPEWAKTVLFGTPADLQRMIANGFDPNSHTEQGTTALMMAIPDATKVKLLLSNGAQVNTVAKSGFTPLMVAANSGEGLAATQMLVDEGASQAAPKGVEPGATPLLLASFSNDLSKVKLLYEAERSPKQILKDRINLAGIFTLNPLEMAMFNHNAEMVKYFVKAGADIDCLDQTGLTPLERATLFGDTAMVETLSSLGANVNYKDAFGMNALLWACTVDWGNESLVKTLIKHGANKNSVSKTGQSPLQLSGQNGLVAVHHALSQSR